MGDIVDLTDFQQKLACEATERKDLFLINEGLAVLAAYRSIRNDEMRMTIKGLVEAIARTYQHVDALG